MVAPISSLIVTPVSRSSQLMKNEIDMRKRESASGKPPYVPSKGYPPDGSERRPYRRVNLDTRLLSKKWQTGGRNYIT